MPGAIEPTHADNAQPLPRGFATECGNCGYTYGQHESADCPAEWRARRSRTRGTDNAVFRTSIFESGQPRATDNPRPPVRQSSTRIVGYARDADTYCARCTAHRYGRPPRTSVDEPMLDENGIPDGIRDREGNEFGVIFAGDEYEYDVSCGSCGRTIIEGSRRYDADDEPFYDGWDLGEYDNGGRDENEPANGCRCVDCIAASLWTPEVA